jgi:hypothetical protein
MVLPDPVLTASIYCDHGLDALIHGAIVPFRARLRDSDPDGGWTLWLVRYSRCGEHLKVRLHGPAERREIARRLLEESVQAHFDTRRPAAGEAPRVSRPDAPPIDLEDEASADHPDRALLWTGYRRSHVNLGPPVFLDDDQYTALFTTCLARGADLVLDALHPDASGNVPGSARQKGLLKALFSGIAALRLGAGERAAYLAYHRDWLVRFNVADPDEAAELLTRFDRRLEGMAATVQQLARVAAAEWEGEARTATGAEGAWRDALAGLLAYLVRFRGDPRYQVDPFTDDAALPPLFKVFHAMANHLGVSMLDEAFVYHLLLRASAAEPAGRMAEPVEV